MLPSMSWMEDRASEGANNGDLTSLSSFKSMLGAVEEEDDWFVTANNQIQTNFAPNLLDSSASSNSVFSHIDLFLHPKPPHHQIETAFDIPFENPYNQGFSGFNELVPSSQTENHGLNPNLNPSLNPNHQLGNFQLTQMRNLPETPQLDFGSGQFANFGENLVFNRPKILKPLDNFTSIGSPPTLFQKRAALRKNLAINNNGDNVGSSANSEGYNGKRKFNSGDEGEDMSMDGYDSDDFTERVEESGRNGGNSSNGNSTVTINGGDQKGKKKGLPAKNLMAERRRRKKLNDRLYMLRSVVPKISKMDRASILGDAIEYLKELLQKINDLHNELETNNNTPPGSSSALTPNTTSFYPVTPTTPGLSSRIKEELCPSSLPSPNGQPIRVEVRQRDGRAVNIHMFCGRRPGLLLSTMRALDNLGLDIQQAVISCFNGFALDIFRAEQCREGQEVHPDQIKAVLLDSAGLLA